MQLSLWRNLILSHWLPLDMRLWKRGKQQEHHKVTQINLLFVSLLFLVKGISIEMKHTGQSPRFPFSFSCSLVTVMLKFYLPFNFSISPTMVICVRLHCFWSKLWRDIIWNFQFNITFQRNLILWVSHFWVSYFWVFFVKFTFLGLGN